MRAITTRTTAWVIPKDVDLRVDVSIVGVLLVVAVVDTWALESAGDLERPAWLAGVVQVVVALLLLLRRSRPFPMVLAMFVVTLAWWLVEGDPPVASAVTLAFAVAAYSLGRHAEDRAHAWLGLVVVAAGLALHIALTEGADAGDVAAELPWDLLILGTWVLGALLRYRGLYLAGVREAAVQEERARIAREVHDVVVHGLSVMVVQAEVADTVLETGDTKRAQLALAQIQRVGRESLDDLRASIGHVTKPGSRPSLNAAAVPSVADLDGLVDRLRAAGLDVDLRRSGELGAVSPLIGQTAYRVVQEGLTNTLRHSRATQCRVVLDVDRDENLLRVTVSDSGPPIAPRIPGTGAGLRGMAERVTAVGGRLDAHPCAGGFTVTATLPVAAHG